MHTFIHKISRLEQVFDFDVITSLFRLLICTIFVFTDIRCSKSNSMRVESALKLKLKNTHSRHLFFSVHFSKPAREFSSEVRRGEVEIVNKSDFYETFYLK